ncbi:hypothetical protein [Rhizobium rhizogenes]|uniref:hypothetical protein n=1 Tax=Rhizobium rhizogenes TaxID=359 RepID=UPI0015717502|nr:hypothetical protein [Rhizobium rhizogenes]NTF92617.1 hypothetical protein [Rhizobium rhizogenes]
MDWTLGGFITLAASAGILSAAVTASLTALGSYLHRRSQARYLALRLSILMDQYFHRCLGYISEATDYNASSGTRGQLITSVPVPADLPSDAEAWLNLKSRLADRTLSMEPRIAYANREIQAESEHHGWEDAVSALALTSLYQIAQDAYILSYDLRHRYRFKQLVHSAKSYQWLLSAKDEHSARLKELDDRREESNRKMLSEMDDAKN